jgi:hypothetical protein
MPTSTYEPIATQTLGSAASSVTFSSIPSTYTDLVIICNFGGSSGGQDFTFRYNGDTGSNYSDTRMYGDGTNAISNRNSSATRITADSVGVSTSLQAFDTIQIFNYANTTTYKTCLVRVADAAKSTEATVGLWRNTAAITQVDLAMTAGNLLSGSTFTLYGIKAA